MLASVLHAASSRTTPRRRATHCETAPGLRGPVTIDTSAGSSKCAGGSSTRKLCRLSTNGYAVARRRGPWGSGRLAARAAIAFTPVATKADEPIELPNGCTYMYPTAPGPCRNGETSSPCASEVCWRAAPPGPCSALELLVRPGTATKPSRETLYKGGEEERRKGEREGRRPGCV